MKVTFQIHNIGGDLVGTVPKTKVLSTVRQAVIDNAVKYHSGLGVVFIAVFADGKYLAQTNLNEFQLHPVVLRRVVDQTVRKLRAVADASASPTA
jgi:hypothetical protein